MRKISGIFGSLCPCALTILLLCSLTVQAANKDEHSLTFQDEGLSTRTINGSPFFDTHVYRYYYECDVTKGGREGQVPGCNGQTLTAISDRILPELKKQCEALVTDGHSLISFGGFNSPSSEGIAYYIVECLINSTPKQTLPYYWGQTKYTVVDRRFKEVEIELFANSISQDTVWYGGKIPGGYDYVAIKDACYRKIRKIPGFFFTTLDYGSADDQVFGKGYFEGRRTMRFLCIGRQMNFTATSSSRGSL